MNADQIAEIRPAIREAIKGAPSTCVTLQVTGEPAKWIQIVDHTLNAAYPHGLNPNESVKVLPKLALRGNVVSWESGKFATFQFDDMEPTRLAHWIDAYFVGILDCAVGEYHVDVACEEI